MSRVGIVLAASLAALLGWGGCAGDVADAAAGSATGTAASSTGEVGSTTGDPPPPPEPAHATLSSCSVPVEDLLGLGGGTILSGTIAYGVDSKAVVSGASVAAAADHAWMYTGFHDEAHVGDCPVVMGDQLLVDIGVDGSVTQIGMSGSPLGTSVVLGPADEAVFVGLSDVVADASPGVLELLHVTDAGFAAGARLTHAPEPRRIYARTPSLRPDGSFILGGLLPREPAVPVGGFALDGAVPQHEELSFLAMVDAHQDVTFARAMPGALLDGAVALAEGRTALVVSCARHGEVGDGECAASFRDNLVILDGDGHIERQVDLGGLGDDQGQHVAARDGSRFMFPHLTNDGAAVSAYTADAALAWDHAITADTSDYLYPFDLSFDALGQAHVGIWTDDLAHGAATVEIDGAPVGDVVTGEQLHVVFDATGAIVSATALPIQGPVSVSETGLLTVFDGTRFAIIAP